MPEIHTSATRFHRPDAGSRSCTPVAAEAERMRTLGLLAAFVLACCVPTRALAGSPTCTIGMTTIAFGNVDVLGGSAVDTTATITVSCSGGGGNGQRLCISIGAGSAGDATSRQFSGGTLRYDLYRDSSRTVLWGSWQTGYDTAGLQLDVAQNSTTAITVYGRLFGSQQTAAAGSYSSTFTANPFMQYDDKATASCPTGIRSTSTSTSASATVVSKCNVTATSVNFGSAGSLATNKDATGTLQVQCSNSLPYVVALNGGNAGATNPTQRKMAQGATQITYGLYRDSSRTQPWGSTTGTDTVGGTGTGGQQSLTVFGRVPTQTTPAPATYSDSVVVTVTY
jgi:spore coat protein U-like protein